MDEAKLIAGMQKREEKAFSDAIACYSRLMWVVASRYLSKSDGFSSHDIEECLADVFFDLWQNIERYDPEKGNLKTYLCTLTSRRAISRYRKSIRTKTVSIDDIGPVEDASLEEVADLPDYSELYNAIAQLPEPTREILNRRYFFDEQPAIIATKMGLPKKEVENRLYRGKQKLSRTLPDSIKEAL